jgi:CelD/BcsL family acetyltransferase involved in cellulose biosynthesis
VQVEVVSGRELDGALAASWRELQRANPALQSPYFCVEFTRHVAAVRDDVFVAIAREGAELRALLPFQRSWPRVGRPVGGPLSDYQGVIARPDTDLDAAELVRGAGLDLWRFDHLLASQRAFAPYHARRAESPLLDLREGYEAFEAQHRQRGSRQIKDSAYSARRLARELGPLRFEACVEDRSVLEAVLAWKTEQSQRTGTPRLFEHTWARDLILRIHASRGEDFAGVLSALWAGDRLLAGHMGMRSARVWHYWFPAYDRELSKHTPGIVLLLEMARSASALGIETIDLGKGEALYKERLKNGAVVVAEGRVALPSLTATGLRLAERGAAWLRRTPLAGPARLPARALRRLGRWASHR